MHLLPDERNVCFYKGKVFLPPHHWRQEATAPPPHCSAAMSKRVFLPVTAMPCVQPLRVARQKQSPNDKRQAINVIITICRLEIASSPHAATFAAPRNDVMLKTLLLPKKRIRPALFLLRQGGVIEHETSSGRSSLF